jgi:hypothetical protein
MGTELLLIWINKLSYTYPHYCLDLEDKTTEKKCGWTGGAALRTWVWVGRGGDARGLPSQGGRGHRREGCRWVAVVGARRYRRTPSPTEGRGEASTVWRAPSPVGVVHYVKNWLW